MTTTPRPNYNPDVLTCLANLSNDEIFTPPVLANELLDRLPAALWTDPTATFLDPVSKSGVFLREITKRLIAGLEGQIPDLQTRLNHIFTRQVFGLGITELTALLARRSVYCAKKANSPYALCTAFGPADEQGNIRFARAEHRWQADKCRDCGASRAAYDRDPGLENHAYEFLHTDQPAKLFNVKFDVIIGNPPYQLSDGGPSRSASPIYHRFIQQAKKLNPRYLTMIVPARWFAGGKGLDEFRAEMLNDARLRQLVDFENASDVFPGVDVAGGICYFLWDRDNPGLCEVTTASGGQRSTTTRRLNEFATFVRQSQAVPIVRKILEINNKQGGDLSSVVVPRKPFGLPTNYTPQKTGIPCWFIQRLGRQFAAKADVSDEHKLLNKWKLLLPKAPIAGQTDFSKPVGFYYDGNTRIAQPGECCTESWIVAGAFDSEAETVAFKSYLFTKTVRFLLLQTVISQDVTRKNFCFIPHLKKYSGHYTDEQLIAEWGISAEEWAFIDSKIKAVFPTAAAEAPTETTEV